MTTPMRKACSDADDNMGTAARSTKRDSGRETEVASIGELKILQIADGRVSIRRVNGPFLPYLNTAPGRSDVALLALDVARRLVEAERRAEAAERRASESRFASEVLAISAEHIDAAEARAEAAEARVRELDAALEAVAVDRQRMQADVNKLIEDNNGLHDECTALLTRARNAERRCVEQDVELIARLARITGLEYKVEQARGQVEAERIKASARIRDLERQRDNESTRAANAEAACRDATAALVKAEAAVERARECVRHGLSACSDEEFIAEYNRRFSVRGAA